MCMLNVNLQNTILGEMTGILNYGVQKISVFAFTLCTHTERLIVC